MGKIKDAVLLPVAVVFTAGTALIFLCLYLFWCAWEAMFEPPSWKEDNHNAPGQSKRD